MFVTLNFMSNLVRLHNSNVYLFIAGGSLGAGYGASYGGGAMKSSGYSQRAAGPYGGEH